MRHFLLFAFLSIAFTFTSTAQIETEDPSYADEWAHFITSLTFSGDDYSGDFSLCNGYIAGWSEGKKVVIGFSVDGGESWEKYYTIDTDKDYGIQIDPVRAIVTTSTSDDFLLCASEDMGPVWLFTIEKNATSLPKHMPSSLRERTSVFTGGDIDVVYEMPDIVLEASKYRYISEISGLMASLAMEMDGGTEMTTCRGHISIWPEPGKLIVNYSKNRGETTNDKYVLETDTPIDLNETIEQGFLSYSVTDNFLMCANEEDGPVYFFTLDKHKEALMQHFPESLSKRAQIYTGRDLSKTILKN